MLFCWGGVPPFTETLCFFSLFIMAFLRIAYARSRRLRRDRERARSDDSVIVAAAWRQSPESSPKTVRIGVASLSARTGDRLRAPETAAFATLMTVLISTAAFYGSPKLGAGRGDDFRAGHGFVAGQTTGE